MSGTIAGNGEHLMQDFRAGKIVGANNRHLTYLQLIGVPIGSAAVAIAYPALRQRYGFGADGLTSPISVKWAGFAELLNLGFSALPAGALKALIVALVLGVVMSALEGLLEGKAAEWLPSPTAVGLGMLIPGYAVFPMVIGGIVQHIWMKVNPKSEATYNTPLAAGMITGEALLVLALSIAAMLGFSV
jgi:uncharacterized oligopeptide transporter (OPT) family protein